MNIEQIGPNRFRFIDDPPYASQGTIMREDENPVDSVEMVPETHKGLEMQVEVAKQ